jgi:hypothetical protein
MYKSSILVTVDLSFMAGYLNNDNSVEQQHGYKLWSGDLAIASPKATSRKM